MFLLNSKQQSFFSSSYMLRFKMYKWLYRSKLHSNLSRNWWRHCVLNCKPQFHSRVLPARLWHRNICCFNIFKSKLRLFIIGINGLKRFVVLHKIPVCLFDIITVLSIFMRTSPVLSWMRNKDFHMSRLIQVLLTHKSLRYSYPCLVLKINFTACV